MKVLNVSETLFVTRLILDNALQESRKDLMSLEVLLLVTEGVFFFLKGLLEFLDLFSLLLDLFFLFVQFFIFVVAFLCISLQDLHPLSDVFDGLLLFFLVLLSLGIQVPCSGDNLFLLSGETLISISFLSFLLKETNCLKWTLT